MAIDFDSIGCKKPKKILVLGANTIVGAQFCKLAFEANIRIICLSAFSFYRKDGFHSCKYHEMPENDQCQSFLVFKNLADVQILHDADAAVNFFSTEPLYSATGRMYSHYEVKRNVLFAKLCFDARIPRFVYSLNKQGICNIPNALCKKLMREYINNFEFERVVILDHSPCLRTSPFKPRSKYNEPQPTFEDLMFGFRYDTSCDVALAALYVISKADPNFKLKEFDHTHIQYASTLMHSMAKFIDHRCL